MAAIALELGALAFIGYAVMVRRGSSKPPDHAEAVAATQPQERQAQPPQPAPIEFITESTDDGARYYRAVGEDVEMLAGFYSDGRLRLADSENRRFAGMLQGSHADLLQLDTNEWSEVFLRVTPTGRMQLELRGGPYDARILRCDTLRA